MQRVFVLGRNHEPLAPCHPARARELLRKKKAAVLRRYPFTIILTERAGGETQLLELRMDPGSKTSGIAIVAKYQRGDQVIWAGEVQHRGSQVRDALTSRRQLRRGRRSRKTRYREPRFNNRRRAEGWLPPSLRSRADNCVHWARRLQRLSPLSSIAVETVRFDTQRLQNPEISGAEYQQGELFGYEVREYILEKFGRKCVYCGAENIPLELEHVTPKSKGGSDRVSNLALSCVSCNRAKGNQDVREFLADRGEILSRLLGQLRAPLKDAAAVNSTRYHIGERLKELGLPVSFWTGGRTKYNRTQQGYSKAHWVDAACVGDAGAKVYIPARLTPLEIRATGRGKRQMCGTNKYGFPIRHRSRTKMHFGFRTGDMVRADVPKGKYAGVHTGRVSVRSRPNFRLGRIDTHPRHLTLLQRSDGYAYDK